MLIKTIIQNSWHMKWINVIIAIIIWRVKTSVTEWLQNYLIYIAFIFLSWEIIVLLRWPTSITYMLLVLIIVHKCIGLQLWHFPKIQFQMCRIRLLLPKYTGLSMSFWSKFLKKFYGQSCLGVSVGRVSDFVQVMIL